MELRTAALSAFIALSACDGGCSGCGDDKEEATDAEAKVADAEAKVADAEAKVADAEKQQKAAETRAAEAEAASDAYAAELGEKRAFNPHPCSAANKAILTRVKGVLVEDATSIEARFKQLHGQVHDEAPDPNITLANDLKAEGVIAFACANNGNQEKVVGNKTVGGGAITVVAELGRDSNDAPTITFADSVWDLWERDEAEATSLMAGGITALTACYRETADRSACATYTGHNDYNNHPGGWYTTAARAAAAVVEDDGGIDMSKLVTVTYPSGPAVSGSLTLNLGRDGMPVLEADNTFTANYTLPGTSDVRTWEFKLASVVDTYEAYYCLNATAGATDTVKVTYHKKTLELTHVAAPSGCTSP